PPSTALYTLSLHDALPIYADRPDVAGQLHLHRPANAELGVRAVRLRRRGRVRAGRRSIAGADGNRTGATQARLGHGGRIGTNAEDRKSTRLNSSHLVISYA